MSCNLKLVLIQIKQHHLRAEHLSVCTGVWFKKKSMLGVRHKVGFRNFYVTAISSRVFLLVWSQFIVALTVRLFSCSLQKEQRRHQTAGQREPGYKKPQFTQISHLCRDIQSYGKYKFPPNLNNSTPRMIMMV